MKKKKPSITMLTPATDAPIKRLIDLTWIADDLADSFGLSTHEALLKRYEQMVNTLSRHALQGGFNQIKKCVDCGVAYVVPESGLVRDLFATHCESCENRQREAGGLPLIK